MIWFFYTSWVIAGSVLRLNNYWAKFTTKYRSRKKLLIYLYYVLNAYLLCNEPLLCCKLLKTKDK
jgi:hypothetical protein